jgi:tetratricopeptide (TPR) repeat protein
MLVFYWHIALLLLLSGSQTQPKELLNRSVQEFQAGEYVLAQKSLEQLIAAYPLTAPAHNLLGLVFMEEKKYTEADQEFGTTLRLQPNSVSACVNRGNALVELHQDDKARIEYMRALSLRPEDPVALAGVGFVYARAQNDRAAVPFLEKAHRLDPSNVHTASALAAVYIDLNRLPEAESLINDLLSAGPEAREARLSLAALALKSGNPELGAKCVAGDRDMVRYYYEISYRNALSLAADSKYRQALRVLLALSPNTEQQAEYHDLLGTIYYKVDDPAKSVNELQEAIRLDPSNPDHYFKLGMMFLKHRTADGAILIFDAALKARPDVAKLWMGLGLSYYVQNNTAPAKDKLYHAISLDPNYGPSYIVLCDMLSQTRADDELLGLINKAMAVEPDNYLLSYYYGKALAHRGDPKAIDELQKSIALNQKFPNSYFELGKFFFDSGDTPRAINTLIECLKVDPDMAEAHYILSRAYHRLGDQDLATAQIAIFEQFRKTNGEDERIRRLIFNVEK